MGNRKDRSCSAVKEEEKEVRVPAVREDESPSDKGNPIAIKQMYVEVSMFIYLFL